MSCSSPTTSAPSETDLDDPLCITESDRRQFSESGAMKRKAGSEDESADSKKRNIEESEEIKKELDADGGVGTPEIKLEQEEEQSETKSETAELEPKSEEAKLEPKTEEVKLKLKSDEEQTNEQSSCKADDSESPEEDFDVAERLKTMDEISVQPVNKSEKEQIDNQDDDSSDKVSIEITKKDKKEDRKVTNLRKNIKDVIDDTQLDATTLAAQRQESERLARVQEQQRLIREAQRQMAAEKQSNKTQQKVLSILQGSSPEPPSLAVSPLDISSSLSITPTAKTSLQSLQSLISTCDDDDSDDDVVIQPDEPKDKSAVVVDSSSDSDDCIILSDEEEEDVEEEDENNSGEHTNDLYNQRDSEGRVVVNIGHDEKEENIYVAPQIARIIKPHQIGGVRFLFDNIIESVELFDKSSGFGCILAHSMGLGKTLQLVCFCDIFLRHTNSKSILVIMPINTLQNWLHEFNMWLPLPADVEKSPLLEGGEVRPRQFNIFVLNDSQKTLTARARTVLQWSKEGGVLMMGYEMYRLLSLKKQKKKRGSFPGVEKAASASEVKLFDDIHSALVNPGPDLIVCDEGHRIKNAHASTSVALKQIRSKRRIVLTGYPLQNNLLEYWCMVDFVRPSYLGTKTEFSNMFERPIQNGQCIDSTPIDCKLMRHRAHVLHSLLKGFVQRRSQMVLQKCLPEKREFVLLIRMTPFQRKLYSVFMDEVVRSKKVPNPLKAFAVCCKIWNHPDVLYNFLKKRELDLDIELEEAEAITSGKSNPAAQGPKKRGRKTNESKGIKKEEKKGATEDDKDLKKEELDDLKPVKLEATVNQKSTSASTGESFKTSQVPPINGSAYSSNQSMSSNFDSSSSSFNSYSGYPNYDSSSYQNYNNYNNGNYGYQNWQGQNNGSNYWQNNFYQSDFPQQNYYPQQSQQQQQPSSYQQPYYANSNYQSFEQKPPVLPKADSADAKSEVPVHDIKKLDGGLLADEIKEEAKELQDKSSKDKDDSDTKDPIAIKSSRDDGIPYDWAVDLMKDYIADLLETSPKMEIFFCILEESITVGDRLLVFSQSLLTLNIMERFLQKSKTAGMDANWARNVNYFRLDGSTAALEREKLINEFNSNTSVKLFLVSTRAGSLGINLVGANRVIVFDASWNPCHDTQAVCRVYRYGQAKSCFVYRFVMDNCLEKKIYDRQINKQGMADRVVDECNPDAHLSMREVTSLCYDDGEDPELKDFGTEVDKYDDLAMKKILESHSNTLTKEPFQHDSLLVDRKEMKLSQAEKRIAQRNYEKDKQAASKPPSFYGAPGSNYRVFRTTDGSLIHRPVGSVRPVHNEMPTPVMNTVRPNPPRPTRWVPVEVWQSKGLTAQEMTLPQDVSIQTNAADKSKIYLKAGQKVIVLKSPKGICLQLESGKVIAIRASVNKNGPQIPGSAEQKIGGFMQEAQNRQNFPVGGSVSDVIDISNDDDDDDEVKANVPTVSEPSVPLKVDAMVPIPQEITNGPSFSKPLEPNSDPVYKDKVVYKPNLVPRKPKLHPSTIPPPQDNRSQKPFEQRMDYQPRMNQPPSNKWESYQNPVHQLPPASQVYNGGYKNSLEPYRNPAEVPQHPQHSYRDQPTDSSAFHQPGGLPNPYPPPVYPPQNVYQNAPFQAPSYPPAQQNNFGYPYHNASYPNAPSYQYSPQTPQNFDQTYPPYQGINYNNQISSTNTIPTDQSSH